MVGAEVQSGACCSGVRHVTPWLQPISRSAVDGGAGRAALPQRVKEEDDAAACPLCCDKEDHFINCGPTWHDLTINLNTVLKVVRFIIGVLFLSFTQQRQE